MCKNPLLLVALLLFVIPASVFSQCSFTITTTVTNVSCYNGTSGSISVSVTGGTSPYQYQLAEAGAGAWQSPNVFTALAAATYPVSVKDASGCIKTVYVAVTQPAQLVAAYTAADPTCTGSTNGSINTTVTGGTAPYTYSWTKDGSAYSTSASLSGLSVGNYLLVATDAAACATSPVINQQVRTIGLTGFNEDVIANGASVAANSVTSNTIDNGGAVYYAAGYSNSTGTGTGGLPASGAFTSAQSGGRAYQLAPYSASNVLALRSASNASNGGSTSGTLTFASNYKGSYATLYVVGTTGSGTGVVNYTVNFSDATTSTGSLNFADWFLAAATASTVRALGGLDRVSWASPGTYDNLTSFNLYEAPITIPGPSLGKTINNITFAWSASSAALARVCLFAVTGYTSTSSGIRINDGPAASVTPSVTVASDASSNTFCSAQTVVFTATPAYGGSTPSYQWKLNAVNTGAGTATYTTSSLNNNDHVTVVMTAAGGVSCLTTTSATSSIVSMTLGTKAASVSASASSSAICSGANVTFAAAPVNGGSLPSYQWKLNGVNTGTNSAAYASSSLNNSDQVSVVMTSNIGCATTNPATSTAIPMTVTANGAPTVVITSVPSITFSSSITYGGGTPVYQWYRNGTVIGGAAAATYHTGTASIGDVYSLKLASSYACATAPAAMSNYIAATLTSLPVVLESFTLTTNNNEKVILNWQTSFESNNKQFLLQRATVASQQYQTIGAVQATNNQQGHRYSYTDEPPLAGTYLYRLIQEDIDGRQTVLGTLQAILQTGKKWRITDNGANWTLQTSQATDYYLLDLQGRLIEKGSCNGTKLIGKPAGSAVYMLQVIAGKEISIQKLVR